MASLTLEELTLIIKIVNENDSVLEHIVSTFTKAFAKSEHFRICCGLTLLIQDSILLNRQRLVAAVILCGAFKSDIDYNNPFLSVLLDMVESYSTNTIEKSILSKLLRSNRYYNEMIKKNITQVYSEFSAKEADELDCSEVTALRNKYEEVAPSVCSFRKLGIPAVVSISNYPNASVADILSGTAGAEQSREDLYSKTWTDEELAEEARVLDLLYGSKNFRNTLISPEFVQFCPPVADRYEGEDEWQSPDGWMDLAEGEHPLLLDQQSIDDILAYIAKSPQNSSSSSGGSSSPACGSDSAAQTNGQSSSEELDALMRAAIAGPLTPKQQTQLVKMVRAGRPFMDVLTPDKLPGLVNSNWAVAVQCFVQILVRGAAPDSGVDTDGYLRVFEEVDMSFHTIEVFNGLSAEADLPPDFTQRYMSKCMLACENAKDKFSQSRFVRLVCAVLQSLIRKNPSSVRGLFAEIQTFCLAFSKAKEAISLYALIKSVDSAT